MSWILIAGYGSMGRRHLRNLKAAGREDVRLLRSGRPPLPGFETPEGAQVYKSLDRALEDRPDVVIVANPTAMHAGVVRESIRAGAAVVLEKPVCADLAEAQQLLRDVEDAGGTCSMAYSFRYHPLYRALKALLAEGRLGRVFHYHARQASYLPSWHPWEDYRTGYAARRDLGGGVVRTLDHELDMLRWTVGQPHEVFASAGSLSGIGVDVDDTADMIFRLPENAQAHVHVSFGRRDYGRGVTVVGEEASAVLDWRQGTLEVRDESGVLDRVSVDQAYDLNEMYTGMLEDALAGFAGSPSREAIPLSDGVAALAMAEGALASSRTSRSVSMPIHYDLNYEPH
jgi:predicted dehydrogenase